MIILHSNNGDKTTVFVLNENEASIIAVLLERVIVIKQHKSVKEIDHETIPKLIQKQGEFHINFSAANLWLARSIVKGLVLLHKQQGTKSEKLEYFLKESASSSPVPVNH